MGLFGDTRKTMKEIMEGVEFVGKPKKLANNTYQYERPDGTTVIRLHLTDIIEKRGATTVLNTGGYHTPTTKERFNDFSGYRVYSDKGLWFVANGSSKVVPFYDGMELPEAFDKPEKALPTVHRIKKLKKQIKKFLAELPDPMPRPGPGDCFLCQIKDSGGIVADPSHLEQHIEDEEMYWHGSLILNALEWRGYPRPDLFFHLNSRDIVKRAVRAYLYRMLNIA